MEPSLQASEAGVATLCWQEVSGQLQTADVSDLLAVESEANVLVVHHYPLIEVRAETDTDAVRHRGTRLHSVLTVSWSSELLGLLWPRGWRGTSTPPTSYIMRVCPGCGGADAAVLVVCEKPAQATRGFYQPRGRHRTCARPV